MYAMTLPLIATAKAHEAFIGAPVSSSYDRSVWRTVQQELMRHASIQTTMNVYGPAMPESKRAANGKVVTMVLKPLRASA